MDTLSSLLYRQYVQNSPKVTKLIRVGSGLPNFTLDYWSHDAHAQVKAKSRGSAVLQQDSFWSPQGSESNPTTTTAHISVSELKWCWQSRGHVLTLQ